MKNVINQVVTVDSSPAAVMSAIWHENDSYLQLGYNERLAKKVNHFKRLGQLNRIRIAKGMDMLRTKDEEIIAKKLEKKQRVTADTSDLFEQDNRMFTENSNEFNELGSDLKELEAIQRLTSLFSG